MLNKLISNLSVKRKLSLIIGILLVPLLISISIALFLFGINVNTTLESRYARISNSFHTSVSYYTRQLRIYAKMISKHHDVARGAYFNNTGAILKYIIPVKDEIGLDRIDIFSKDAVLIARAHQPEEFNLNSNSAFLKSALTGKELLYIEEQQNSQFVLKAMVPIYHINIASKIVGAVTVGYILNNRLAKELKRMSNSDILFVKGNYIIATSFDELFEYPILLKNPKVFEYIEGTRLDLIEETPGIERPEGFSVYIAINNNVIRTAFLKVIILLLVLFLTTAGLALWITIRIGSNIKNSINIIHRSTTEIDKANYQLDIHLDTKDEFKDLADTLNSILRNIDSNFKTIRSQKEKIEDLTSLLSNIIETMPSVLISIDKDGFITQWNRAATDFTAIDEKNSIGQQIWDLLPEFKKFREKSISVVSEQKVFEFYRESFSSKRGQIYNVTLFPIIKQGMGIRIDNISELEKKDEQLRQSQKMEIVGTLSGGLAHDFNNVLGGISGALSIISVKKEKNPDIAVDEIEPYITIIEESAERAADMVQQVLNLSKKSEADYASVDINMAIKRIIGILKNTISKSIEISTMPHQKPALILGNANQIDQVLLNLCVNAAHAMTIMRDDEEAYGGKLSMEVNLIPKSMHFALQHPEAEDIEYWNLSVADTGVGIDAQTIPKIFDPFFTTKEKKSGTGLGLSMVYNIVKKHRGFVDVYSETGNGTIFNLYFPAYQAVEEERDIKEVKSMKFGEGLILVIDDEKIMQHMAEEILKEVGYTTLCASDGEVGVELFTSRFNDISAVVLDMSMPKISGKDTFIRLREIDPTVKVLLVSGFKHGTQVTEMMDLGVRGFLQKPYTVESLSTAVWETIQK